MAVQVFARLFHRSTCPRSTGLLPTTLPCSTILTATSKPCPRCHIIRPPVSRLGSATDLSIELCNARYPLSLTASPRSSPSNRSTSSSLVYGYFLTVLFFFFRPISHSLLTLLLRLVLPPPLLNINYLAMSISREPTSGRIPRKPLPGREPSLRRTLTRSHSTLWRPWSPAVASLNEYERSLYKYPWLSGATEDTGDHQDLEGGYYAIPENDHSYHNDNTLLLSSSVTEETERPGMHEKRGPDDNVFLQEEVSEDPDLVTFLPLPLLLPFFLFPFFPPPFSDFKHTAASCILT